ncbi:MAG: 4-hydroxy-tetrahydrodipicolinate synthase, partial [Proteobacteria bacterium]
MLNAKDTALYTAVVTPFTESGTVNYAELDSLLHEQARAGNGIVVLGSTGEGMALSEEEKIALVKHAAGLNLAVPLLVG